MGYLTKYLTAKDHDEAMQIARRIEARNSHRHVDPCYGIACVRVWSRLRDDDDILIAEINY